MHAIRTAPSPEAAARLGRMTQRLCPKLVRSDWDLVKIDIMRVAVWAKFEQHMSVRSLLLSTGDAELVEASPNDYVWGTGLDGTGKNLLGILLQSVRDELRRR